MGDTTPDLSEFNKLIHISPCNATGNVGDAAASNTELLTDDVIEVGDCAAGTPEVLILQDHLDFLDGLRVELGRSIPVTEATLGITLDSFLGSTLISPGSYNSLHLWCWLSQRGLGGADAEWEAKSHRGTVFDDGDSDLAIPGNNRDVVRVLNVELAESFHELEWLASRE